MISRKYSRLIGVAMLALALSYPVQSQGAATVVDNLILSPNGEFTELTVVGGGSTLCNHFTEPAKGGAPFRIVLDFCDATHGLGQMNFGDIPRTRIAKIRTSQYATSPQDIVRVVLDMREEATYSVVKDGTSLTVRVVDPGRTSFAVWKAEPKSMQSALTVMAATTKAPKPMASAKPTPVKPAAKAQQQTMAKVDVKAKTAPVQPVVKEPKADPQPVVAKTLPAPKPSGDAVPSIAVKPSTVKEFTVPQTPLVFSPEVLANPDMMKTSVPTVAVKTERTISKESMTPIGPQMNTSGSDGQVAGNSESNGLWASTTEPGFSKSKKETTKEASKSGVFAQSQAQKPQQYAVATDAEVTPINEETTLIERLKDKFFGTQSEPRPYTTVGDGMAPNDVQGPPSPGSSISREELLARIQEAQKRASGKGGYYRRDGEGAGGVESRVILHYDNMGRRDPFAPLVTGQRSGFVSDELPNVETLRLVGVLHDDTEAIALLENLEGYGYILRVNDPVKNGSLIAIQNTRALFRVDDYGWSHVVALQLTSRGSDPSKSLGSVQQEYPTYQSESTGKDKKGNSTGNQGSEGE